ncbi:hypothetical protein V8E36_007257 [Tilletia maclaganii]
MPGWLPQRDGPTTRAAAPAAAAVPSSRTHLPHHAALHRGSLDQRAAPSHQEHHPAFSAPSSQPLFAVPASVLQELHVSKTASGNNSPRSGTSTPVPQLLSATSSPQTIYAAPRSLKVTSFWPWPIRCARPLRFDSSSPRKYWPTAEYNFSSIPDRLFGSPAAPGLRILSRILDQAHQLEYDLRVSDFRGAGPYGPRGEQALLNVSFQQLQVLSSRGPSAFEVSELQVLSAANVSPLASCLIQLDLGLNPFAARQLLLDGHLYGRLLFPLLPTSPLQDTSPPPTPSFPQDNAGTTTAATSLVDPLQPCSPLSPRLDLPDAPAASVDPLPPQAPLSPKVGPPDSPTLCIDQTGPRTHSQPPLCSPGSLRTPQTFAAPLTSAPSTLSRQEFLDVTLQDAYIEGPMLAPPETATFPGLCQAPSGLAFQNPTPPVYKETSGSKPFQPHAYW